MAIKIHHLRPAPGANTAKTRVGRGEGSKGKTAGRGTKGTKARKTVSPRFEGGQMPLHMRLPKLKGFKNRFKVEYQVVNLDKISALFPNGGDVDVAALVEKGAVRKGQPVKVLGTGDITVKVNSQASGSSADNLVKTKLSTGTMDDVFLYNTGSLLQAINPDQNLVDLRWREKPARSREHVYVQPQTFDVVGAGEKLRQQWE